MIRLLLRIFHIYDYEVCYSCETLKQQLQYEREEKKQLIETLLKIVSPKLVETPAPIEINQIAQSSALFSRRRAAMEIRDKEEARIIAEKKHIGMPDSLRELEKLESELGIELKNEGVEKNG